MFPKADGLGAYWANIKNRIDAISEVPATHWRPEDYYDADPKAPDRTYAHRGGFLDPVDFYPLEFGIAPKDIEATDTSQLLGMMVAQQALEDAGYGPSKEFSRDRVSVVMGVTGTLELVIPLGARLGHPIWRRALNKAGVEPQTVEEIIEEIASSYVGWQENSFPGLLGNVVAGRIANRLDLHGTNCVVDAACASSLSAVHLAALELASGRADMVVSGGIDTFNDIFMYMCFSKTPALSKSGNSRPFDADADGTILGEGLGVLVLKRLQDAERDGDRIYAVLRSVGTSSDGKGNAVYAPSAEGQMRALRNAYELAGITPDTIEYVEAHGTGTKVGDATEVKALTSVYRAAKDQGTWCALGSVKSQIGHTKAAAGVAGVIKATLALHHKIIPPTIKVDKPIESLVPGNSPFYVSLEKRPWLPRASHPRRAAVSAFGFGGSNFHCVLEEYGSEKTHADWDGDLQLVSLSADSREALAQKLRDWPQCPTWNELRAAAAKSRQEFDCKQPFRLTFVAEREKGNWSGPRNDLLALLEKLKEKSSWSTPEGAYYSSESKPGKLALLFPGQGAQYLGMLRDLACTFPVMQRVLAEADRVFHEEYPDRELRLSDHIYPQPLLSEEARQKAEQQLRATEVAQPAIGAVSLGSALLLSEFGIQADAFAGHSYGELPALCAAGRFNTKSLHRASMLRGRLMAEQAGLGTMLAVKADLQAVERILVSEKIDVVIANKNSPQQIVLSGTVTEIERAESAFSRASIRTDRLSVSAAFHSPLVSEASRPFRQALGDIEIRPGNAPVFSNTTGQQYPDAEEAARELLAGQLAMPVEFVDEVRNMHAAGVRTFVEVGPGARLTGLVKAILAGSPFVAFSLDASSGKHSGMLDLARTLAQLAALGYPVRLENWDPAAINAVRPKGRGMAVPICGANHFQPKPKTDAKPAPRKPVATTNVNSPKAELIVDRPATTTPATPATLTQAPGKPSNGPSLPMSRAQTAMNHPNGNGSKTPTATHHTVPVSSVSPITTNSLQPVHVLQDGLLALQRMQQETAELHRKFLENQQLAQQTFQQLLTGSSVPQSAIVAPVAAPAPPRPTVTAAPAHVVPQAMPAPATPPVSVPTVASKIEPRPQTAVMQDAPKQAPRPVAASPAPAVKPAPAPQRAASSKFAETLLEVVAEKTGYPAEMLDLGMGLDADLGIDSIKRVEILSALQERLPEAPQVKPDELGTFQTLQQIVDFLSSSAPVSEPAPEPAKTSTPAASPMVAPAAADSRVQQILLEVVAEKTGYPAEMLDLDMGLDADLGVDSIKRVEILSALQERLPEAPAVQPDQLGTFQTLRQIVAYLSPAAASPSAPVPATATASPHASNEAITKTLLEVVAEKTGYPAEMLDLDMGLDADLGIDSIKRVEILSALQERLPEAPAVQPDQLGTFQTLGQIATFLAAGTSSTSVVAEAVASPVTHSSQGSPADSTELATVLLEIVAEKTGYPVEMLELDMGLDSDLGIDSIKRVEILSALQERRPELPAVQPEQLGSLQTLRQIVELLSEGVTSSSSVSVPQHSDQPATTANASSVASESASSTVDEQALRSLQRFVLEAKPIDELTARKQLSFVPDGELWIVDGGSALCPPLAGELASRGLQVSVHSSVEFLDLPVPAWLAGVVFVAGDTFSDEFLLHSFQIVQRVAGTLRQSAKQGDVVLASISRLDGRFGLSDNTLSQPISGGLAGLIKTARREWPEVHGKAVDVGSDVSPEVAAACIADELGLDGPEEVGIESAGTIALSLSLQPVPSSDGMPLLDERDIVLVTGGARGVTAQVATAIARRYHCTLILLGRTAIEPEPAWLTGLTDESQIKRAILEHTEKRTPREVNALCHAILAAREVTKNLDAIRQAGGKVEYRCADVTDRAAVEQLLESVRDQYGPITGLVHGAGVIEDRRIEDKTVDQFRRVYDTKVAGLTHLLDGLQSDPLKALVLFSSSTARYGRVGQVDYAVANEVLNKLAQQQARLRPDCRVLSVNWGPWDGGMVTPALRKLFAEEGIGVICLQAGAEYLVRELDHAGPVETVILGPDVSTQAEPVQAKSPAEAKMCRAFEKVVGVDGCPVLRSHVMDGKAVLPVALMMEWLGHAALHVNPGLAFHGMDQLRVLRGLRLGPECEVAVELLSGSAEKDAAGFVCPVSLVSTDSQGKRTTHAQCRVRLGDGPLDPQPAKFAATEGPLRIAVDELYPRYLFHGPLLQGIFRVEGCNENGISLIAQSAAPPKDWLASPLRGSWLGDPLVLDVAFQAMIVWCWENMDAPSLPTYFESYRQYHRSFPRSGTMVHAKVRRQTAHQVLADFEFVDSKGSLVATLSGYECTVDASLARAFGHNRLLQSV